jgi:hypothetical protein
MKTRISSALVLAMGLALAACTEPSPRQTGLTGRWIEEGAPAESARDLLIGQPGVFVFTEPHADGSVTFISGDWEVDGNHITFTTTSRTDYPAAGSPKKTDPYVDAHFFESATFTLTPTTLTLTYLAYPAGSPVTAVMILRRDESAG